MRRASQTLNRRCRHRRCGRASAEAEFDLGAGVRKDNLVLGKEGVALVEGGEIGHVGFLVVCLGRREAGLRLQSPFGATKATSRVAPYMSQYSCLGRPGRCRRWFRGALGIELGVETIGTGGARISAQLPNYPSIYNVHGDAELHVKAKWLWHLVYAEFVVGNLGRPTRFVPLPDEIQVDWHLRYLVLGLLEEHLDGQASLPLQDNCLHSRFKPDKPAPLRLLGTNAGPLEGNKYSLGNRTPSAIHVLTKETMLAV